MKTILGTETITIPEDVTIAVKSRKVTITGPRGVLVREFKHLNLELRLLTAKKLRVDVWFGKRKDLACVHTICTHIKNMIKGVTLGYKYKMKYVYAHFPINVNIADDKKTVEIRNFLGERIVRTVNMLDGVTVASAGKDEVELQ
eukprot:Ihof_evm10s220 gene=Ihof_evmTU10s220